MRKIFAFFVSAMLLTASVVSVNAAGDPAADKARTKIQKIGVGEKSRVEVKMRDKTKIKGYVSASDADSFTVTDSKTGTATRVAYADVAQVNKQGGISPTTWAIIAGSAAAAVIVGVTVLYPVLCDGGAGC